MIHRIRKVCQSPLSWEVGIHFSEPGFPLESLLLGGKSHWSGDEVRMLLTKPGPFEVRNPYFIVLVGDPGIAKFYTISAAAGAILRRSVFYPTIST